MVFEMALFSKVNSLLIKFNNMYTNISSNNNYPKTLVIRNEPGGMVWQIYHVNTVGQAERISLNATSHGFHAITLEDHQPDINETWPDWRLSPGGIEIMKL